MSFVIKDRLLQLMLFFFLYSYITCPFTTRSIMTLHNFLTLQHSALFPLIIDRSICSAIHLHKLARWFTSSFPLPPPRIRLTSICRVGMILQSSNFFFIMSPRNCKWFYLILSFFLKTTRCSSIPSMISSAAFCRSTFLLYQYSLFLLADFHLFTDM